MNFLIIKIQLMCLYVSNIFKILNKKSKLCKYRKNVLVLKIMKKKKIINIK